MRILVLTPYPHGKVAGPRSSFELWERPLREAGIALDYVVFENERLREILYGHGRSAEKTLEMLRSYVRFLPEAVRRAHNCDAVLVNREATLIGPAFVERAIAASGKRLIYLLDDPLYIPYRSPTNGWLSYLKCFGKVKTLCRMSSLVVANSPSHYMFASRYNRNVWEIPSVVDGDLYTGRTDHTSSTSRRTCLGWSGSQSTVTNVRIIREPLSTLTQRADVTLRIVGAQDVPLDGIRFTASEWHPETEVRDLRAFDIGLLPLRRTPWTPHKFYLKLVQYMALGIPPVATPLGANQVVVDHGRTGYLASSTTDWIQTLTRLVDDVDTRAEVGDRAANVARARYTLQANSEKIVAAFRSVAY